ncbi:hypothetical protein [Subtercola endophyticus]|uniref:hypothetical protein n=1 Tax=Subtercola endophyticus TaxID=2895559 RepID=UPI001E613175|nr:hypothetical protein [Subtercola endophyticus]UFS57629.1 hypothetical protein LQ955_11210 [Subtercola endophyticus]
MPEYKVREIRLRNAATRQGLQLQKSRLRDPNAIGYGLYRLVDLRTGAVVTSTNLPGGFGCDLDDIEARLTVVSDETDDYQIATDWTELGNANSEIVVGGEAKLFVNLTTDDIEWLAVQRRKEADLFREIAKRQRLSQTQMLKWDIEAQRDVDRLNSELEQD